MAYTPLTPQQYQKAINAGFSPDAIIQMEKQRKFTENTQQPEEKFFGGQTGQQFTSQPLVKQIAQAFVATLPKDFADLFVNAPVKAALSAGEALSMPFTGGKPQGITAGQIPIINKIPGLDKTMTGRVSESQQQLDTGKKPFGWHAFVSPMIGAAMDGLITAQELKSVVGVSAKLFGDAPLNDLSKGTKGVITKGVEKVFQKTGEGINAGVSKLKTGSKDVMTAGRQIKDINAQLAEQPMQKFNIDTQVSQLRRDKQVINESIKGLKTEVSGLGEKQSAILSEGTKTITSGAQQQTAKIKEKLIPLFRKMTQTYGKGLESAEATMAEKGITISSQDASKVLEDTINFIKANVIPEDSTAFKIISDKIKYFVDNPNTKMSLNELKNFKNEIYETLKASVKAGNKYAGIEDKVATTFLQNYGRMLGEFSPELKQLNQEFATMANARNWAMRTFKPYNPAEIDRGANALVKIGKQIQAGKITDKTVINYLKTLEEGSGQFSGAGKLTGNTLNVGLTNYKLVNSIDREIGLLNSKLGKLGLSKAEIDKQIYNLGKNKAGIKSSEIILNQQLKRLTELKKMRNEIIKWSAIIIGAPTALKTVLGLAGNNL